MALILMVVMLFAEIVMATRADLSIFQTRSESAYFLRGRNSGKNGRLGYIETVRFSPALWRKSTNLHPQHNGIGGIGSSAGMDKCRRERKRGFLRISLYRTRYATDECASNPCHHGWCSDFVHRFTCTCQAGYEGIYCQKDTDECASNPCVHGTCIDHVNRYSCTCTPGYGGKNCQIDIDECASNPCVHGTCIDHVNRYSCTCKPGYGGTNCQLDAPDSLPYITDHANGSKLELAENSTISLICVVKGGNPRPTLWWTCPRDYRSYDYTANETRVSLQWRAVRNNDGPCRCSSYHPTLPTNQTVWIDIQVFYPPSAPIISIDRTERNISLKIINDTKVSLLCQSSGRPTPQLRWQYLGQQTDGNNTTVTVTQNSTATCTASNTLPGSITKSSRASLGFHILYGPSKPEIFCASSDADFSIEDQSISAIKGDSLTLICLSQADPLPSYYWNNKEGQNTTFQVSQQGTHVYKCSVTNMLIPDYGSTTSMVSWSSANVKTLYGPTTQPSLTYAMHPGPTGSVVSPFSVVENSTFSITCDSSDGEPSPTYEWNGGTSTGGKLEISSIKRSKNIDSNGISFYTCTCTARNTMTNTCGDKRTESGTTHRTTRINILYPASIQAMTSRSVVEGNTTTLTVLVNSHGSPRESYIWYQGKDVVHYGPSYTMANTSRTHAGTYTIEAVNHIRPTGMDAYNSSVRQSFYLDVFYTTAVTSFTLNNQQNSITVMENDTVTLRCAVDSNPLSNVFVQTATHNGDRELTRQSLNDITYIMQTTCYDSGTYRCYGQNNYTASPSSSQFIQLFVLCTPRSRFPVEHNITYNKALNTSVDLNLTWFAYPEPPSDSLQWMRLIDTIWVNVTNDRNTNITTAGLESRLSIHSLQQSDFGQYGLSIQYNGRSFYHLFFIGPQDKPQPPSKFLHVDEYLNQTSAVFRWTPGFDGGLEQTFIILYKPKDSSQWAEIAASNDTNNVTIGDLSAGTVYLVKMFANNSNGRSSDTETLEITTKDYPFSDDREYNIGVTAGAAGGGGLAVILIVAGLIFICFRKRRKDDKHNGHLGNKKETTYYNTVQLEARNETNTDTERSVYERLGPVTENEHAYGTLTLKGTAETSVGAIVYENVPKALQNTRTTQRSKPEPLQF